MDTASLIIICTGISVGYLSWAVLYSDYHDGHFWLVFLFPIWLTIKYTVMGIWYVLVMIVFFGALYGALNALYLTYNAIHYMLYGY
jgi:hypothetical protein